MTVADFHRLVPLLPGADPARTDAMSACGEEPGGRRWRATLSKPRVRTVGGLSLPVIDVDIEMTGYGQPEARRFLDKFHLVFHKGGG